jgi:hypothetical protein
LFVPEEEEQWLYRGVHGKHPMLKQARLGIVIPGDVTGSVTAEEHNYGKNEMLAMSPFTSWTERRSIAEIHARRHGGGVVLRLRATPRRGVGWSWEISPDRYFEDEVLLRGVRIDAEVLP